MAQWKAVATNLLEMRLPAQICPCSSEQWVLAIKVLNFDIDTSGKLR